MQVSISHRHHFTDATLLRCYRSAAPEVLLLVWDLYPVHPAHSAHLLTPGPQEFLDLTFTVCRNTTKDSQGQSWKDKAGLTGEGQRLWDSNDGSEERVKARNILESTRVLAAMDPPGAALSLGQLIVASGFQHKDAVVCCRLILHF